VWCEDRGLTLTTIRPFDVSTYIETLQQTHSAPSVKQQLAAVRMLFDWLICQSASNRDPRFACKRDPLFEIAGNDSARPGGAGQGCAARARAVA